LGQSASERQSYAAGSPDDHGGLVCEIEKRMTHEVLLGFSAAKDFEQKRQGEFTGKNYDLARGIIPCLDSILLRFRKRGAYKRA